MLKEEQSRAEALKKTNEKLAKELEVASRAAALAQQASQGERRPNKKADRLRPRPSEADAAKAKADAAAASPRRRRRSQGEGDAKQPRQGQGGRAGGGQAEADRQRQPRRHHPQRSPNRSRRFPAPLGDAGTCSKPAAPAAARPRAARACWTSSLHCQWPVAWSRYCWPLYSATTSTVAQGRRVDNSNPRPMACRQLPVWRHPADRVSIREHQHFHSSFIPAASQLDSNEVDPVARPMFICLRAKSRPRRSEAAATSAGPGRCTVKLLEIYSRRGDKTAFTNLRRAATIGPAVRARNGTCGQLGRSLDPTKPLFTGGRPAQARPDMDDHRDAPGLWRGGMLHTTLVPPRGQKLDVASSRWGGS